MSGRKLRSQFMSKFAGMQKYPRTVAYLIVASYVAQILGMISFGSLLLRDQLTGFETGLIVGIMIFVATRLRGINNIVHECSHGTFAVDRNDNVMLGRLCSSLVLKCFADYRDEHMSHHQHLGNYEKDLDLKIVEELGIHDALTARTIVRHIITPFLGLHLPYYLGANMSARDGKGYFALKVALIAGAVLFLLLNPITALLMVWVPFVLIYSAIHYWTDCVDHGGLILEGDELHQSRNLDAPYPVKLVLFPRNDTYHLVHHLFPHVPARHLHVCHKELMTDPEYAQRQLPLRTPVGITTQA